MKKTESLEKSKLNSKIGGALLGPCSISLSKRNAWSNSLILFGPLLVAPINSMGVA